MNANPGQAANNRMASITAKRMYATPFLTCITPPSFTPAPDAHRHYLAAAPGPGVKIATVLRSGRKYFRAASLISSAVTDRINSG